MVAGAINDDSGSVSDSDLSELSSKNMVSIGVSTVSGDNFVTLAEETAGFTVTGTSFGAVGETVTATSVYQLYLAITL
jgi:hypothetical protein